MTGTRVNIRKVVLLRAYIAFALVLCFACAIVFSATKLQWSERSLYDSLSREKRFRTNEVPAIRGNIFAADGNLLATSVPYYDLIFDPLADGLSKAMFNSKVDSLAMLFALHLPTRTEEQWRRYFREARARNLRGITVAKELTFEQIRMMKTWPLITLGKFKGGFWTREYNKRIYFMGDLARRSVGAYKKVRDKIIYYGLEGAFDSLLRGRNGLRTEQKMYGGAWRPIRSEDEVEAINGMDIITTLDVNLQDVAQYALRNVLAKHRAHHGCAVLMETATGEIKAIANLMNNGNGEFSESLNYAVDEFSDPGSTFKLVSVMALLDEGHFKPEDSVDAQWGTAYINGTKMEDAKPPGKKYLTLNESFIQSSNVGISKFVLDAYGDKPKAYIKYIKSLGLDQPLDFDIRAKGKPTIKTPGSANWYPTTLPWMSIGYETGLSPLQMLTLYNAIANGGTMVKPYMVKEIRLDGKLIERREPEIIKKQICKPETLKALQSMMLGVVASGTAYSMRSTNYQIAGKTGTNQLVMGKAYAKDRHKASFVGYFPANDPQYTCIVVVVDPKDSGYYGGAVAGPVFREIADRVYSSSYKLHPGLNAPAYPQMPDVKPGDRSMTRQTLNELGISAHSNGDRGSQVVQASAKQHSVALLPVSHKSGTVPDTRGMGLRDALYLLENAGMTVKSNGYGSVRSQSVAPGTRIQPGMNITLTMSSEP